MTHVAASAAAVEQKRRELLARVTQKRAEVCAYLDTLFYTRCRSILHEVRALDTRQIFAANPSSLPEYTQYVRRPMYFGLIEKRLAQYDYASAGDFIADMRLLVDNCYAYNGHHSPFSATARAMEVRMEDLFVRELGAAPPHMSELHRLGTQLAKDTSAALWKIITLYEGTPEQPMGKHVHVHPGKFKCATQRRILDVLRRAVAQRASAAAAATVAAAATTTTSGHAAVTVRQPLLSSSAKAAGVRYTATTTTRRAGVSASASSSTARATHNDTAVDNNNNNATDGVGDDDDDEVHFHALAANDAAAAMTMSAAPATTTTLLERVPQNTRMAHSNLHQVSPVHLPDDDASVEADESTGAVAATDTRNSRSSDGDGTDAQPAVAAAVDAAADDAAATHA